jgi:hypothetical protein
MTGTTAEVPFWSDAEVAAAIRPALARLAMRPGGTHTAETV